MPARAFTRYGEVSSNRDLGVETRESQQGSKHKPIRHKLRSPVAAVVANIKWHFCQHSFMPRLLLHANIDRGLTIVIVKTVKYMCSPSRA